MTTRRISELVKKKLLFNQNYKCLTCDNSLPYTYEIDHKTPYAISQNNSLDNLQALCPNCHALKTKEDNIKIKNWKNSNSMDVDLEEKFTCECKHGFTWKNRRNFKKHFSSLRHNLFNDKNMMMEID